MKKPKTLLAWVIGTLFAFILSSISSLFIEKLVNDPMDDFIAAINQDTVLAILSFIKPHIPNLLFVLVFVGLYEWFRMGWRPSWLREIPVPDQEPEDAESDDEYPLKDDLIELNGLVQICANRLRGLGVLENLHVVNTSIQWQRLWKGLARHKIAHPPTNASSDVLYRFLIDLDDPTHRGKITESRRVGVKHVEAYSIAQADVTSISAEDGGGDDEDDE